jgi:type I restriction enzyme S subunit
MLNLGAPFSDEPGPGLIRLLQIRDFSSDRFAVYIKDLPKWPKCEADDILIARYGASLGRILTGKAGAYNVAMTNTIYLLL